MRNRERISLPSDRHITGSSTQRSKGGESKGPQTLGMTIAREGEDDNGIIEENSVRTQKSRKRGRDISRCPRQPL